MKLTCPCCGAVASAEAWQNDLEARAVLAAAIKLDEPIPRQLLPYLGLFRPAERSLSWKRTARLIQELSGLVATGYVQVQGKPARPCPPQVWALAMEQMTERGMAISRPMGNQVAQTPRLPCESAIHHNAGRMPAATKASLKLVPMLGSTAAPDTASKPAIQVRKVLRCAGHNRSIRRSAKNNAMKAGKASHSETSQPGAPALTNQASGKSRVGLCQLCSWATATSMPRRPSIKAIGVYR